MEHYARYSREVIPEIEESLSKIASLVTDNALVLDVGCSSGMMGRFLAMEKGCIVDGIDIDESAIEKCKPVYRKVTVKNLEADMLTDVFVQEAYDFIIVADVLEHLFSPDKLLSQLKLLVKPHGSIIFSIPNITHAAVPLALLTGDFNYSQNGLLDNTHIRFYSCNSLVEKLRQSGLYAWESGAVYKNVAATEFGDAHARLFPQNWLDALVASRPDALVYQWIVSARIYPRIGHEAHASSLSQVKGVPVFTSALYWESAAQEGFSEHNKIVGIKTGEQQGRLTIDFTFPDTLEQGLSAIRIDPVSEIKAVWIVSAMIISVDGAMLWEWRADEARDYLVEAKWLDTQASYGKVLLAENDDPQWYPAIPSSVLQQLSAGARFRMVMSDAAAIIEPLLADSLFNLERLLDELALKRGAAESKVSELERVVDQKQQALTSALSELDQKRQALAQAAAETENIKRQLATLFASHSWRVTAPLRKISRIAHNMFGGDR